MYKTMLPTTGAVSTGIFGLSTNNTIATGISLIIIGIIVFKLIRFKIKDRG